jgi:glutamyl-tRNA synthetase
MPTAVITRFAPSPTGSLHLGNLRTALFNYLYARRYGGRFVLRIEDTDRARSQRAFEAAIDEDLAWLGLDPDAGPGREDGAGPYRQSERVARHAEVLREFEVRGLAYPCFCTDLELELTRKRQLARGEPPRYAGTCASLSSTERAARQAAGRPAALRFRVPVGEVLVWEDLVRGPQIFRADDLGDFIVQRADGTVSFLAANAIDDADMGITHVLRGEDHVANTPRQRLLVAALGVAPPLYGHVPLLIGPAGSPLSKRDGAASLATLRADGYLPRALLNFLGRLGHSGYDGALRDLATLGRDFDPAALGRAPAHVDLAQLGHWQREAVRALADAEVAAWFEGLVAAGQEVAYAHALRANLERPADAHAWVERLAATVPALDAPAAALVAGAGVAYWDAALGATGGDYAALVAALKATGARGAGLFRPLRLALTGRLEGPELAPIHALLPRETLHSRFTAARALALTEGTNS